VIPGLPERGSEGRTWPRQYPWDYVHDPGVELWPDVALNGVGTTMADFCRPTILVVDHDAQTRSLVCITLAAAEFQVLEARSGLEGMAAMLRFDFEIALAVLEINLPGISGLDLANQIRIERRSTEVLYISGLVESIAVNSIALIEPEAVLFKPFTARQLLARVHHLLSRPESLERRAS